MKVLAAQADARWAAKPSFLDRPGMEKGKPVPALRGMEMGRPPKKTEELQEAGWDGEVRSSVGGGMGGGLKDAEPPLQDAARENEKEKPTMQVPDHKKHYFNERPDGTRVKEKKYKEDPWKAARGAPSDEWQPQAWSPNVAATKR